MSSIDGNGIIRKIKNTVTAIFMSIGGLVCQRSTFESRKTTAVSAAILCLAVLCDVMNTAGRHGTSVGCVMP